MCVTVFASFTYLLTCMGEKHVTSELEKTRNTHGSNKILRSWLGFLITTDNSNSVRSLILGSDLTRIETPGHAPSV